MSEQANEEMGTATAQTQKGDDITTRLRPIFTQEGLDSLAGSRVLVFGCGGVGSSCVEALARATVGELFLVDRDTVDPSNMNRQALAFECTVGRVKVEVMGEMVHQINPRCRVEARQTYVSAENLAEVLAWAGAEVDEAGNVVGRGKISYVVDAIDTITQKLALAKICWDANIPEISSMGAANRLNPEQFQIADITKSHGCRMARTMRKECGKRRIPHLQVLYSPEPPVRPASVAGSSHGGLPNLGTASYMPPIMGQMVAGRVIRALIGYEPWPWDKGGSVAADGAGSDTEGQRADGTGSDTEGQRAGGVQGVSSAAAMDDAAEPADDVAGESGSPSAKAAAHGQTTGTEAL